MIKTFVVAALIAGTAAPVSASPERSRLERRGFAPAVHVWLNGDGYYRRGDRARVYFETDSDAYVTVFRIDTDGRVRVLYPQYPWHENLVYGGRRYEVVEPYGTHADYAFRVDEYPGQGYVFAVASYEPFDYRAFTRRDHWDYEAIAYHGRVTGDPYVAFDELVDHIVVGDYAGYTTDVYPYSVEQRYSYPRFLCYDCHAYVPYRSWNPYRHSCVRFRIVIYDDPYYYPARAYAGTRVVYKRPGRYAPRYVFKDRAGAKPYVTRERRRPTDHDVDRRSPDRGATRRDVNGMGRIPAPATSPRASDDQRDSRRRVDETPSRTRSGDARDRPAVPGDLRRYIEQDRNRAPKATVDRPKLERREPATREAGEPVRKIQERTRRPEARPTPQRSEQPRVREVPKRRSKEPPSAQRSPARRPASERQARPAPKRPARATPAKKPARPAPKRKPKKKDPQG